jgi:hypothetical protein
VSTDKEHDDEEDEDLIDLCDEDNTDNELSQETWRSIEFSRGAKHVRGTSDCLLEEIVGEPDYLAWGILQIEGLTDMVGESV